MKRNEDGKNILFLNKSIRGLFIFMLSFFVIVITVLLNIDNIIVDFLKQVLLISLFYSIWFGSKYVYTKNKELIKDNSNDKIK